MTDDAPDNVAENAGGTSLPATYPQLLANIKTRIRQARTRAALSVNSELVRLYWEIGGAIVERQRGEGWGSAVIEQLSRDLRQAFPGPRGFSAANLWRMRSFYLAYRLEDTILAQPVRELACPNPPPEIVGMPWGHNIVLIQRLRVSAERLWYARQALEHGWSRAVLNHQIDSGLYHRQGQAITNFEATLPPPDSDLAKRLLKDPYAFDFLDVGDQMAERKLESKLIDRLQHLLLELGRGFTFVGSQYRIGLILCRERNRLVVEYTLEDVTRPMGVATYQTLPEEVRRRLPSPEQLEAELFVDR